MKPLLAHLWSSAALVAALSAAQFAPATARAITTVFFSSDQTTNLVAAGTTSDSISSEGYVFTFTRDKLFTGGSTNPIGRAVRVPWPEGLEAQAVTAGPVPSGAKLVVTRQDGRPFAIDQFTFKLLANTAGAGASIEVMPMLNGEDGLPNPVMYNATRYYGSQFTYATPELTGFDAYKLSLYVDYALMSLTVVDASVPPPFLGILSVGRSAVQLSWSTNAVGYVLESAASVDAATWVLVPNAISTIGDLFTVQVDVAGTQAFFRLRK